MKKVCPVCKGEYVGGEMFCPIEAARLVTPSQMSMGPSDAEDPLVGTQLDKYKIFERIGEGGMGLVYSAEHTVIEKKVAIKVLREDFSSRPEVVERFRQEAKSASRIGHENIVDISDFGSTPQGQSYFVMEFLEGEDLANVLAREGALGPLRIIALASQCCRALGAAHAKGIVHRDMKPENVFLISRDSEEFVKIVDFGIAKMSDIETSGAPGRKLTKTGMIFGTPEYMSPEQAAGKELDHRVDIYAMGVILYELVTGRVPFVGDTFMGVLTQHMFEEPPPLKEVNAQLRCSAELEMVIFKALAKDPAQRYQSMEELGQALEEAKNGRISEATLHGYGDPVKTRAKAPRLAKPVAAGTLAHPMPDAAPRRAPMVIAAALLLVSGAGIAFVAMHDGGEVAANDVEPPVPDPVASPPDPEPDPVVTPTVEAESTHVALTVQTVPNEGARVSVEGHPELECEPTPCVIEVPRGEAIVVHAERERSRGSSEVAPRDPSTIQIALVRQPSRGGTMRRDGSETPMGMNGASDLKMPPIFQ